MPSSQGGANDPVINSFWTGAKVTPSSTSSLTRDITVLPKSQQKTCREWCHMISPIPALLTAGQMVLADGKHDWQQLWELDWSSCTGARLELPRPRNTQDTSYNTRNTGHCIFNTEHGTLHITHMALHSEVHIVHETQGKLEKTRDPPHNTRNTQDNRFNTYNT